MCCACHTQQAASSKLCHSAGSASRDCLPQWQRGVASMARGTKNLKSRRPKVSRRLKNRTKFKKVSFSDEFVKVRPLAGLCCRRARSQQLIRLRGAVTAVSCAAQLGLHKVP